MSSTDSIMEGLAKLDIDEPSYTITPTADS